MNNVTAFEVQFDPAPVTRTVPTLPAVLATTSLSPIVVSLPPFSIIRLPGPPANWPTAISLVSVTTPPASMVKDPGAKFPTTRELVLVQVEETARSEEHTSEL